MEEWRAIEGTGGRYEVSDQGRIKKTSNGNILSGSPDVSGYVKVNLSLPQEQGLAMNVTKYIHTEVMRAFVGPRPANRVIDHGDRNRNNNALSNLAYVSLRQNARNAALPGDPPRELRASTIEAKRLAAQRYRDLQLAQGHDWTPVGPEAPNYEASRLGLIRRIGKRGALKGFINDRGYLRVEAGARKTMQHRLVWFAFHGRFDENTHVIDHRNGDRLDNRVDNLRLLSKRDNFRERQNLNSNNTSGVRGVYFETGKGRFRSEIQVDGRKIKGRVQAEVEDAADDRIANQVQHWGASTVQPWQFGK